MEETNFAGKVVVILSVMVLACSLLVGSARAKDKKDKKTFTTDFQIEACTWSNTGRNPYFSLNIGDVLRLTDGQVVLDITVLDETRVVNFGTQKAFR